MYYLAKGIIDHFASSANAAVVSLRSQLPGGLYWGEAPHGATGPDHHPRAVFNIQPVGDVGGSMGEDMDMPVIEFQWFVDYAPETPDPFGTAAQIGDNFKTGFGTLIFALDSGSVRMVRRVGDALIERNPDGGAMGTLEVQYRYA